MNFTTPIVIGLEIHVELNTQTKLFCSCSTSGNEEPNTRTCVTCLGMPGSKPVLNAKALEYGIKFCLATGSTVAPTLVFSRKNYFYPDLAKNYQTSQYELPLGSGGKIAIKDKNIRLTRAHLEEDPASLVHPQGIHDSSYVLVDYNRSGNPLLEIVTEPDLESPEQAREFMKKLITILSYLEIFDTENGIIKADANISIQESGYIRAEVKNITGFKEIERALFYEIERQQKAVSEGETLILETRSWDPDLGVTKHMRSKESEADYGYIIDPDLCPVPLKTDYVDSIHQTIPKMSDERIAHYTSSLGVDAGDAEVIAAEKELADLFEKVATTIDPVLAAKWLRRELVRVLNYNELNITQLKIDESHLISLLKLYSEKKITDKIARTLMEQLIEEPFDVLDYVTKNDLLSVRDVGALEGFCKEVISEQPAAVDDFKGGNDKSLNFLVGQVMRKSRGKATPQEVSEILRELLK